MSHFVHLDYLVVAFQRPLGKSIISNDRFVFTHLDDVRNRIFRDVFKVEWIDHTKDDIYYREVCEIRMNPCSSVLPQLLCHVKFSNKSLYCYDLEKFMTEFYHDFGFVYDHIVRADIACDFLSFKNGLKPENLIRGLLSMKYYRMGKGEFKVFGSNTAASSDGDVLPSVFHSITWCKISSGVQVCLYNKSLEMRTAKVKPWIIDWWKNCGLDYVSSDVWRCEIRLQGNYINLVAATTSQRLHWYHLTGNPSYLCTIFKSLAVKYVDIRKLNGSKRVYNLPSLDLFDINCPPCILEKRIAVVERPISERSVRSALSMLRSISANFSSSYMRDLSTQLDNYISTLLPYVSSRGEGVRYAEYVENLHMSNSIPKTFPSSPCVRLSFDIHEAQTSHPRPS